MKTNVPRFHGILLRLNYKKKNQNTHTIKHTCGMTFTMSSTWSFDYEMKTESCTLGMSPTDTLLKISQYITENDCVIC